MIDAKLPALAEADNAAEAERLALRLSGLFSCQHSKEACTAVVSLHQMAARCVQHYLAVQSFHGC